MTIYSLVCMRSGQVAEWLVLLTSDHKGLGLNSLELECSSRLYGIFLFIFLFCTEPFIITLP